MLQFRYAVFPIDSRVSYSTTSEIRWGGIVYCVKVNRQSLRGCQGWNVWGGGGNLGVRATLSGFPRLALDNAPANMHRATHCFAMVAL